MSIPSPDETASRRRERVSTVLELAGAALIVAGVALWSVPVALVVAGVLCLLVAHPIPRWWEK